MNRSHSWTLFISAALSVLLGITLFCYQLHNHRIETDLLADQRKLGGFQDELNRAEISRRVTQNLVQDLAPLAPQKSEVQSLLARYGITLKKNESN